MVIESNLPVHSFQRNGCIGLLVLGLDRDKAGASIARNLREALISSSYVDIEAHPIAGFWPVLVWSIPDAGLV